MSQSRLVCFVLTIIVVGGIAGTFIVANDKRMSPISANAKAVLKSATKLVLYSLHPARKQCREGDKKYFDWKVLGKTELESEEECSPLTEKLLEGIRKSGGAVAMCFNPRHGIQIEQDGKVYDFVICFECQQIQWYVDKTKQNTIPVLPLPLETFNKILTEAKVQLPPQRKGN